MNLLLILMSCLPKQEIIQRVSYTPEQVEDLLILQNECRELVYTFESGNFKFSVEPFVARQEIVNEANRICPWENYPKPLEDCLEELRSY